MSKYGNSYSGNNFLEWWKTHYGTDYDGTSGISKTASMTDEDYAIGQQLYANYQEEQRLTNEYNTNVGDLNSAADSAIESSNDTYDILLGGAKTDYEKGAATLLQNYTANSDAIRNTYQQNSDTLFKNYGTAQGALADSKRQSQQNASITLDKLKKYLPTQIKAQGLGGLGVSESSMLQAYNNYNSDMGAIESDYQKNKTELETAYNENKTSLDNQHSAAQNDLQTSYNTAQNNLETGYNSTKTKYEGAKAEAEGKIKQQLQADLAALLRNYNSALGNVGKGADGKLLVDGVLDKYAQMLADDQNVNYETAMSLILQALHTDEASMNAIVEGFRGKVSDDQLASLFEQGKITASGNLKTNQDSNYKTAVETIRNAAYTDEASMNAYIESFRGKVSDEQFASLEIEGKTFLETKKTNDEANSYTNFQTMQNNIKTNGSDFYSFDDIDRAVAEKALSEQDGADLKKFIETTAINELSAYVSAGDYDFAATEADSAYKKGKISQDAYQSLYYDLAIGSISGASDVKTLQDKEAYLTNLKNAGKITAADYNSAVSYMYSSAGNVLSSGSYSVAYTKNIFGTQLPNAACLDVTMGGKTYELETVQTLVDSDTASVLSKMVGGSPTHGSLAQLGDQIYIYRVYPKETDQYKNGWIKVKTYNFWTSGIGTDNKDFYTDYATACGRQAQPTKPEHNSSTSTSSGSSASIEGFKLPYRATTSETQEAKQAILNNDFETFRRYMPSSYSEEQCRKYYERYGGK